MLNLLKCSPNVKVNVLNWIGNCLKSNSDKGKIWNSQMPDISQSNSNTVSDGFMFNLNSLLMRLCQPFCNLDNLNKILKVDPTYCAVTVNYLFVLIVHLKTDY